MSVPRISRFEIVPATGVFNALQIEPRSVLAIAHTAVMSWLKEHWASYPRFLTEHSCGLVVIAGALRYDQPLTFAEVEALEIESWLRTSRAGTRAEMHVDICGAGRRAVQVELLMSPVEVGERQSLGATAGAFPDALLARLRDDEKATDKPQRQLPQLLSRVVESGRHLGSAAAPFVMHRRLCEVADQGVFSEVPAIVEPNREALALAAEPDPTKRAALLALVARPMRSCVFELRRPYYWRDVGETRSDAYVLDGATYAVHRLLSSAPISETHGFVIEQW